MHPKVDNYWNGLWFHGSACVITEFWGAGLSAVPRGAGATLQLESYSLGDQKDSNRSDLEWDECEILSWGTPRWGSLCEALIHVGCMCKKKVIINVT